MNRQNSTAEFSTAELGAAVPSAAGASAAGVRITVCGISLGLLFPAVLWVLRGPVRTSAPNRLRWLALLLLTVSLSSGCGNDTGTQSGTGASGDPAGAGKTDPPGEDVRLSVADRQQAMRLRNLGLARLENKQWSEAEQTLAELADMVPSQSAALRNLAICRVLMVIDRRSPFPPTGTAAEVSAYQGACQAAKAAVSRFAKIAATEFDKALADLLQGKLLVHISSPAEPTFEEGLARLRQAAAAQPQRADFQMAVALAMDSQNAYSDQQKPGYQQLLTELQRAFELAPDNLYVMINLLKRQALGLNSRDEKTKAAALQITETLRAAQPMVATFNESIKRNQRLDLSQMIADGLEKFDPARPTTLISPGMVTFNLLNPELASQVDQRRINRNLLDYVQYDFAEGFTEGLPTVQQPDSVLTSLRAADGLPPLTDVEFVRVDDMDLDGRDDLVLILGGRVEVYSRQQQSWRLLMASPPQPVILTGVTLADLDRDFDTDVPNLEGPIKLRDLDGDQKIPRDPAGKVRWFDADLDLIAWGDDGLVVMHNVLSEDGSRSLQVVEQDDTVQGITDVVVADLEFDGDLDLAIGTNHGVVLRENRDGSEFARLEIPGLPQDAVRSLQIGDFNQDYAIDVGVVLESGAVGILENALQLRFRWRSQPEELSGPEHLVMSAFGSAGFPPAIAADGLIGGDFDNDTFADVLCYASDQSVVLRGGPQSYDADAFPALDGGMRSAAVSDLDDDGDLDIIFAAGENGQLRWLQNEGGNDNNWIDLVTRGVPNDEQFPANRINMHAIGSTAELRAGALLQTRTIQAPRVHFGLGDRDAVDVIRVTWTDGVPQNAVVPSVLKRKVGLLHPQILKGSCPYIYTWNGEQFVFFSDCLWAAPIGLVQASGEIAPTREWENLLIPGEMLQERDGRYELQLTEELWEVAYFDQVELTAIDHPADVSVFTNEKVGPPAMAEHRVHTVQQPRLPVAIVDGRGADLLPGLSHQDGNYIQAFEGRVLQGLTDEWVLEFDLGELPGAAADRNIRLFLLGWIFPTDTSLNRHIETNPELAPPMPPVLEIPDGNDGWTVARPFIGFPSGKTKAMVVDISDVLQGDNTRFRLRSTMELYFDQAFFTVNETDAATQVQSCPQVDADLHYRGFSRRVYADNALFRNGHAPEGYDYQSVLTAPRWPEIFGRFTRYGDVSPLTDNHDDRLVVMGPGDELTVSFAVPSAPVPDGWKRDFVLRNVGYDKDADLNTIYGQTSEPFPFQSMSRYPFSPDERAPETAEYLQYLESWQTRQYDRGQLRRSIRD